MKGAWLLSLLAVAGVARGETVLRIATVAPDGTAWAHVARDFARDVEDRTSGAVKVKWYFGGVAGNEKEQLDRIQRGQLDGAAITSACLRLSPSMSALYVFGLVQSRAEASAVLTDLRPRIVDEMSGHGFVPLVLTGFGSIILFSRHPVRRLEDLPGHRYWVWDQETLLSRQLRAMGVETLALPVEQAHQAYEDGRVDGFFIIPAAALAFQLSNQARYFTDLRAAFLGGCLVMSSRSFYKLSVAEQDALRHAGDILSRTFDVVMGRQDEQLVGGLFQRQGVQQVPAGELVRSQFFAAAQQARTALNDVVPAELIGRVAALLADWRAEHR